MVRFCSVVATLGSAPGMTEDLPRSFSPSMLAQVFPNPTTSCEMSEGTAIPTIGNYLLDMEKPLGVKQGHEKELNFTRPHQASPTAGFGINLVSLLLRIA